MSVLVEAIGLEIATVKDKKVLIKNKTVNFSTP
jgi:hypothetical protein